MEKKVFHFAAESECSLNWVALRLNTSHVVLFFPLYFMLKMNTRLGSQDRMPYCFIYAYTYLDSIGISVDIPYSWSKICEQKADWTDVTVRLLLSNL